ncbi:ParB/RepB/Spo0J family partition protein [Salinibius halmophilus]|uniref:ParB/RepB/Spo0J family partition protein n=1 Tax=Salinibius halmophilus TaxID=1853216 RepID=UPI000E663353|nr:ParB/RepB/Spo0J family partition protein [Salinibius halmophilus]
MTVKKRGLGRGLNSLISHSHQSIEAVQKSAEPQSKSQDNTLKQLAVEQIVVSPFQPRRDMAPEALEELAASIRAHGIMQPIVVRPVGEHYEIVAGERRWRAAQLAKLENIPALVREVSDEETAALALIENLQREGLNPIEQAMALNRLIEEFDMTQGQVADSVGKSRTAVTNLLRLLKLNSDVRKMLEHGDLEAGHARALLSLSENDQLIAAQQVVSKGLSVRQTEQLVKNWGQQSKPAAKAVDPDIRKLATVLSERLGSPVAIKNGKGNKGTVTIKYGSLEELDGILNKIK